jgi:hypothetical protein
MLSFNIFTGQLEFNVLNKKREAVIVAPQNLSATNEDQNIALSWDAVDGADGYDIYRGLTDVFGSALLLSADEVGITYDDSSGNTGTRYYYWVVAKAGAVESDPSASSAGRAFVTIANGANILGLTIPADSDGTVNGALFATVAVAAGVSIVQDSNGIFYTSGGGGYWEDQITTDPVASSPLSGVIDVYNDTGSLLTFWNTEP